MIYWTKTSKNALKKSPSLSKWILHEDKEATEKYLSPLAQESSLLTRACLRALLFHITHEKRWILKKNDQGKPYVQTLSGDKGPHISISHSKEMISCVCSLSSPIGIDVEFHQNRSFSDIANNAFGPIERHYVDLKGLEGFYKIWTLREAIAKATGEGLIKAADGINYLSTPESGGYWTDQGWNLFYTLFKPNYSLAIATQHQPHWNVSSLSYIALEDIL